MERTSRPLDDELDYHQSAEADILTHDAGLEQRVIESTAELRITNQTLQNEIAGREKSEAKFRALWAAAPIGMIIIDQDARLVLVNSQTETLFGYQNDELIGQPLEILMPERFRESHRAKHADYLANPRTRPMGTGLVLCGLRKDGSEFPVEISLSPQATENGMLIISAIHDLTERQQAEATRSLLASIVESTDDAIIGRTLDNQIISWNPAATRIFGYTANEVVGTSTTILVPADRRHELADHGARIQQGERVVRYETVRIRKDGRPIDVSLTDSPFKDKAGTIVGISAIIRDITGRKLAEQQLRNSHEQLRSLSANLQSVREEERAHIAREIHDVVGQALTALRMELSWLSKKLPANQHLLHEQAQSMLGLIDSTIQSVQRLSSELRPGLLDDLGLSAAIEWQAEQFRYRSGIECEVTIHPKSITLDPQRSTVIFRIFQESLTNVARHARATKVRVRLTQEEKKLILKVRDNGIGIHQSRIADAKSVGLIGMRERVHALGGRVNIKGKSNKGTIVLASIPC